MPRAWAISRAALGFSARIRVFMIYLIPAILPPKRLRSQNDTGAKKWNIQLPVDRNISLVYTIRRQPTSSAPITVSSNVQRIHIYKYHQYSTAAPAIDEQG
jgi:hypothetical protein